MKMFKMMIVVVKKEEEEEEELKGKREMKVRTSEEIAKYLCWLLFECDANVFHERSYWDVDKEEDQFIIYRR